MTAKNAGFDRDRNCDSARQQLPTRCHGDEQKPALAKVQPHSGVRPGACLSDSSPHHTQCIQPFISHARIHLSAHAPRQPDSCFLVMLHRSAQSRRLPSHPPPSRPKASLIEPMTPRALIPAPRPDAPHGAPSLSRPRSPVPHHTHSRTAAFGATMRPSPAIERRANAHPRLHPSALSRRAPQRAIALQAALTSATFTTATPRPPPHSPASHTPAPRQHHTHASNTHAARTTQSRAQLIAVACIVAPRAVLWLLRATDPPESCVRCIVLVQCVCVMWTVRTVRVVTVPQCSICIYICVFRTVTLKSHH